METYQYVIGRIGTYLADIDKNIERPLGESANKYRLTAEAVCKAIIIANHGQPQGMLDKLIGDAVKVVEFAEPNRDAGVFKAEVRYLQGVGNTYSHDGGDGLLAPIENQVAAFDSLIKIIRIAFFGHLDADAPVLPKSIEERIPIRTFSRMKFENPRAEEVVRLCFPKSHVVTKIKRSDHANRLVYDYVVADLGGNLTKGAIFLRSRTALEKALVDFQVSIGTGFPDALDIITPRAYRADGGEIDRQRSILDIVKSLGLDARGRKVQVKYFDEFAWESCLPDEFRIKPAAIKKATHHFVKQSLEAIANTGILDGGYSSTTEYIKEILESSHNYNPVHVVIGPAGIGKTTFCDDISTYINSKERKRVILLSATDFRDISNIGSIESVGDLYRLAAANDLIDQESSIESHNFEINLACGNFVLLIDGFDELESHLGTSLNFDGFMRSLSELEECFRKVLVILTVRDYDVERFKIFRQTSLCRLRGFSSQDTERYLQDRLATAKIPEARALLRTFDGNGDSGKNTTIPLYASLICDYLVEETLKKAKTNSILGTTRFFANGAPLDRLVMKIVEREITKQSLGKIGPDDFFDILIEIIRAPQYTVTKAALIELISSCGEGAQSINSANFLRNPFLRWEGETISFKYDSLTYFFKSRFLVQKIIDGQFSASPSIDFMAEFYRGEGPLYDEFVSIFPANANAGLKNSICWFNKLIEYSAKEPESHLPWRKAISAFMYWGLSAGVDKSERSESLNKYFDGNVWSMFSIFGNFYPLNLRNINILEGYIDNYTGIQNCDYNANEPVFFDSTIIYDDRSLPEKLDKSIFNNCTFSPNLANSFQAKEMADESGHEIIRDNVYKVLKIGFRANHFSWKSKDMYKKATVIGKFSLQSYLVALKEYGILNQELGKTSSEMGYIVSDAWYMDARKLVEEKNLTGRMATLIDEIPGLMH